MLKLTAEQRQFKQELIQKLKTARAEFEAALDMYNTLLIAMTQALTAKVDAFNEVIEEINEWTDGAHTELSDFFDSKSERWQSGDTGAQYSEWMEEFTTKLDELSIDLPEAIELDSLEQVENFEQIRSEI